MLRYERELDAMNKVKLNLEKDMAH
jgi:hypothetical protein